MSLRHKWQNVRGRNWEEIRGAWLADIPSFPGVGSRPSPGLEQLATLQAISIPKISAPPTLVSDPQGIRPNVLWEAVFLFHKCAHANLAAQRLGQRGMLSWCLFNAYHAAYLGAKGLMALLGVAIPNLAGRQVVIDLFPEPAKKKAKDRKGALQTQSQFQHSLIIPVQLLEQRFLWQGFQRVLQISEANRWDQAVRQELLDLSFEEFSPPRNHFLYQAHFWPLNDLTSDADAERMNSLFGAELDSEDQGFLLRLSYSVYLLFEQLMEDLGEISGSIKQQLDGSRCRSAPSYPEISSYRAFLSQIEPRSPA